MYKFKIENMNCMSCVHNIADALKEYDDSIEASAQVKERVLTVKTTVPMEKVKELIEGAGYSASALPSGNPE